MNRTRTKYRWARKIRNAAWKFCS